MKSASFASPTHRFLRPSFQRALSLCALVCTAACDDAPSCPPPIVCDIRTDACQQRAMRTAACLRGDDPDAVAVAVDVIDADTFIDEVVREAAASSMERSYAHESYQRGLVALGLAEEQGNLETDLRGQYERVAAFYSSATRSITILDRQNPLDDENAMALLVHEMVHALQDQARAFNSIRRATSLDMWLARRAMTEGEASLVQARASVALRDLDEDEVDWDGWLTAWQADVEEVALSSTDLVRDSRMLFPYAWGAAHVRRTEQQGGRDAVRALFREAAPNSTAEVLGMATDVPSPDFEKRAVPRLNGPWTLNAVSHLGAWLTRRWFDRKGLFHFSAISGNDALSVFHAPAAEEEPPITAFWRFDTLSIDDANELAEALDGTGDPALFAFAAGKEVWVSARTVDEALPPTLAWGKHEGGDIFFGANSAAPTEPLDEICALGLDTHGMPSPAAFRAK